MSAEPNLQQKVDKVLRDIALKNLQLRSLAGVLLVDIGFLRFCDTFDELQCVLQQASDDELDRYSIDSETEGILSLSEQKLRKLQRLRSSFLQRIFNYNDTRKSEEPECQRQTFAERLEEAIRQLHRSQKNFRRVILNATWRLGDIYHIENIETLLQQTDFLHIVVCNNHRNCLKLLSLTNFDQIIEFRDFLEKMESAESVRTLHAALQQEIRCSLNEMQINEEELTALRMKLFTSQDSLQVQRTIAIEQKDRRGLDLEEQLRTIDLLEVDRLEIEGRVTQLIEQRELIQRQLDERRTLLQDGMREIVRLERLIEQIEREISQRKVHYQEEAQKLEQRRLDILNDQSLSPEDRARLLAECDAEQEKMHQLYASDINLLEVRCDDLKRQSKSLATDVHAFRDEVAQKHRDQLADLERQKLLATTPSQLALIEAQLQQLQVEFDENITMLGRAQARPEYLNDEHGRYYLNEAGERIYKRDSTASEYRMGPDGEWIKVSSAITLQQDAHGTFFVDKFGQKIYQQQHFTDPRGEYYLDESGARIYITTTGGHSSRASSEGTAQPANPFYRPPSSSLESSPSEEDVLEESESMEELRNRVSSDVAYIQDAVGVALRKGLAIIARSKPDDPVGYLSDYLALCRKNGLETRRRRELLDRFGTVDNNDCTG